MASTKDKRLKNPGDHSCYKFQHDELPVLDLTLPRIKMNSAGFEWTKTLVAHVEILRSHKRNEFVFWLRAGQNGTRNWAIRGFKSFWRYTSALFFNTALMTLTNALSLSFEDTNDKTTTRYISNNICKHELYSHASPRCKQQNPTEQIFLPNQFKRFDSLMVVMWARGRAGKRVRTTGEQLFMSSSKMQTEISTNRSTYGVNTS